MSATRDRFALVKWHSGDNPQVFRVKRRADHKWVGWVERDPQTSRSRALSDDKQEEFGWFRNSRQAAIEIYSRNLPD